VMRAVVGPGTTVQSVDYFATGNSSAIDISVGPDGALYYVGHNTTIRRAAYNQISQEIVVSPSHVWMDEGGQAVFMVSLATMPVSNVTVDVAHSAGTDLIGTTSGASLTFTPANFAVPQAVTIQADPDSGTDAATFSVSSAGLTTQRVDVNTMNKPIAGYESPGRVADTAGDRDTPLTIGKSATTPGDIELDWGPSCGAGSDYSVHQGVLGIWYGHDKKLCTTQGATSATLTPGPGGFYFLIVPLDLTREGSYGVNSSGIERPPSANTCRTASDNTSCP
jgi:hypothetical protein